MMDVGGRSAFSTFIGHVSVSEAGAKSAASCLSRVKSVNAQTMT